MVKEKNPL